MTIKVKIENADTRETAVIGVMTQNSTVSDNSTWTSGTEIELKGGDSCEFWVHSTQVLTIREKSQ